MPIQLHDMRGRPVALGREIARGGEGAVFDVAGEPGFVAKLYHHGLDAEQIAKLAALPGVATDELLRVAAWPTATLYDGRNELAGILMPRVANHREIHQLYSPAQRRQHFPRADWRFLIHVGMNVATAFETIHRFGHVVGDVNQSGVLVANDGTVRLIDCDSFQVRDPHGRVFRCSVGVPLYTPAELQGRPLRGLERTVNHDVFGLAVVLFQLLFMGRHPFAGRFGGSGDMPIERAISEGRFAFGSRAASVQMTPPPLSLSFEVVPDSVGRLFDRAFASPGTAGPRPLASEWRVGLRELKDKLEACRVDAGHRYPRGQRECPWCALIRAGGPNFFASVALAKAIKPADAMRVDFRTLWKTVEAIGLPVVRQPEPAPALPKALALPLPDAVRERRFVLRLLTMISVPAGLLGVIGLMQSSVLLSAEGGGLLVALLVTIAILKCAGGAADEVRRRRERERRISAEVKALRGAWTNCVANIEATFRRHRQNLQAVRDRGVELPAKLEAARRELERGKRDEQLTDYLDGKFIRDYRIPRIGSGRLLTLISYGIETAADVDASRLAQLPGFGPSLIGELVAWREGLIHGFHFDPSKPSRSDASQALLGKFRADEQLAWGELTAGINDLTRAMRDGEIELRRIAAELQTAMTQHAQAVVDMSIV